MTECDLYCQGTESLHHLRRPCTRDTEEFQETRQCEAGWRWFQFERAASVSWSAASLSQASASRIVAVIQISFSDNQSCSQKSSKAERDVICKCMSLQCLQITYLIIWSEQSESGKLCTGALPLSPRIKGTTTHDTLQNTDSFNLS